MHNNLAGNICHDRIKWTDLRYKLGKLMTINLSWWTMQTHSFLDFVSPNAVVPTAEVKAALK